MHVLGDLILTQCCLWRAIRKEKEGRGREILVATSTCFFFFCENYNGKKEDDERLIMKWWKHARTHNKQEETNGLNFSLVSVNANYEDFSSAFVSRKESRKEEYNERGKNIRRRHKFSMPQGIWRHKIYNCGASLLCRLSFIFISPVYPWSLDWQWG